MIDAAAIRDGIANWAIWRDGGEWDRLAALWHPQGRMHTTWCEASAADFMARSRAAWDTGLTVIHTMNGTTVDVTGDRAVAITRTTIVQRAEVHGTLVDVVCYGRFWDAWQRHDGRWLLRLRQPVYDLDHMVPVQPGAAVALDSALLASYPPGYRHLAYLQTQLGLTVSKTMPGLRGPGIAALLAHGRAWLAGGDIGPLEARASL